jgi:hypothetical protein
MKKILILLLVFLAEILWAGSYYETTISTITGKATMRLSGELKVYQSTSAVNYSILLSTWGQFNSLISPEIKTNYLYSIPSENKIKMFNDVDIGSNSILTTKIQPIKVSSASYADYAAFGSTDNVVCNYLTVNNNATIGDLTDTGSLWTNYINGKNNPLEIKTQGVGKILVYSDNTLFVDTVTFNKLVNVSNSLSANSISANTISGNYIGKINASSITAGQFGADVGGGIYWFPNKVGIMKYPEGTLDVYGDVWAKGIL